MLSNRNQLTIGDSRRRLQLLTLLQSRGGLRIRLALLLDERRLSVILLVMDMRIILVLVLSLGTRKLLSIRLLVLILLHESLS
jgi:hypothetical protein